MSLVSPPRDFSSPLDTEVLSISMPGGRMMSQSSTFTIKYHHFLLQSIRDATFRNVLLLGETVENQIKKDEEEALAVTSLRNAVRR